MFLKAEQASYKKPYHPLVQALAIVLVVVIFFFVSFIAAHLMHGKNYGLSADRAAPDFQLRNARGELVSLSQFRGKYVYLMFGYMNCDDICHSEALIFQEIDRDADMNNALQFIYIAMDPDRDTPERLAAYFDARGPNFTSLRSEETAMVQELAGEYKTFFSIEGSAQNKDYEISHPGRYFLIDPEGQIRFSYTTSHNNSDLLIRDLLSLKQS